MITELGVEEARALLRQLHFGRLGCCFDHQPYVVPVNYLFDGESLFMHSLPGRKINTLRANPHACLQVDDIQDDYHWRSVIAFGKYEEITEPAARELILAALFRHLPHLTPVESKMTKGVEEAIVFHLLIERITGLCEHW